MQDQQTLLATPKAIQLPALWASLQVCESLFPPLRSSFLRFPQFSHVDDIRPREAENARCRTAPLCRLYSGGRILLFVPSSDLADRIEVSGASSR